MVASITVGPLLLLLLLAVVLVIVSTRLRFPYTAALVVLGITIGYLGQQVSVLGLNHLGTYLFSPQLFFYILLPPIIFEAGLHIDFKLLRHRAPFILFLVFVGVLFTTLLTGVAVAALIGIPLIVGLLLAAIVSPTDPVAVVDIARRLKMPAELSTIVESEALLNDAVGVIIFVVILGILGSGTWNLISSAAQFAWLIVGGILIGVLVAGGTYLVHLRLHDPAVETALSIVAAYGAYLLASDLGTSGIIATAIAGMALGNWAGPRAIAPEARTVVDTFWSVVVYVDNSIIFLAMGLLVFPSDILSHLGLVLFVLAVIYVGRAVFVYVHRPLSRMLVGPQAQLPRPWYNVLTLSGIRGAIPVVLALSLLTSTTSLSSSLVQTIVGVVVGVAAISVVAGNLAATAYITRRFRPGASPSEPANPPGDAAAK